MGERGARGDGPSPQADPAAEPNADPSADPTADPTAEAAIATYRLILARYRGALDLVSPRAYADLDRHLAEAERYAAAVRELADPAGVVLDLGTGAGLPGVVIAARLAPRAVWWVERRRRRTAFLTQVAAHAQLTGVRVHGGDVRHLARSEPAVAAVTAQAVGALVEVAALTRHLWATRVVVISRRGPDWPAEVEALTDWWCRETRRGREDDAGVSVAQDAWSPPQVLRVEPLGTRGSLVAVELRGG